jgi:murein L,D-transpeptidase YcbB/YkuD
MAAKLAAIDPNAAPVAPPIGPGPSLKTGASGERVDRLAAQLTARGLLAAGTYQGVYDDAVEHGVRDFQVSEGMTADGRVGDATLEAFDRAPAVTAAALTATMANVRHLAASAPREFFLVNVPSQTAYLIAGDKVELSMRVAVGRPSRPTPLLEDRITDVILNPTWTAPTTVLAKDKLPSLRRTGHPGIEGATIYLDGEEVDPALVDWSLVTADRLKVVQSPGDQNALGRFKFNLTNGESIYLHDTNDHSVFSRQNRALSSGCVRLAEPRKLAELLLGREGWSPERITAAVGRERTQGIGLNHPLPVRIVYWQATVDDGGVVHVYRDIYGHRGQVGGTTLAKGEAPTRAALNTGAEAQPKAESADVSARAPEAAHQTSRVPKPPATIVAERVSQVARCSGYCGLKLY